MAPASADILRLDRRGRIARPSQRAYTQEGGQQSMRIEGDYEEDCEGEQEVNFVNQSGTR